MNGTQTSETDTQGAQANQTPEEWKAPVTLYDKTEAIVARQEAANKEAQEILTRQETLHANQRLAGTSGGNVVAPPVSEDVQKVNNAKDFWKGTGMADAIEKANG
jgi:hypothetical protein